MTININQSINSSSDEFKAIAPDLQGNILASHGRDHALHIFLRFKDSDKARKLIRQELAKKLTSANQQKIDSDAAKGNPRKRFRHFRSFSLSNSGYNFLNVDAKEIPKDESFRQGQKARANSLGDPNISSWQSEFQEEWHGILVIANSSLKKLKSQLKSIKKFLTSDVIEAFHVEEGVGMKNSAGAHIEHFGYVDGISQPFLLTDRIDSGKISINNWDPRANLDTALVEDPGGKTDNSFGSYLVFRKLEQNVKAFKVAEEELAKSLGISVDSAGAQMVGRFRNGAPLIPVSPPQPNSTSKMNDFDYSSDTKLASKCPFHAHIRKTNPRGSGGAETLDREKTHLFVRRGITYGKDFSKTGVDPEKDVGLLFMAYNSKLSRQFEFMQSSWANNSGFPIRKPNGRHGIDAIIGQGSTTSGQNHFKEWGADSTMERTKPSIGGFVTMKGGEYFFTPSISFLKSL